MQIPSCSFYIIKCVEYYCTSSNAKKQLNNLISFKLIKKNTALLLKKVSLRL